MPSPAASRASSCAGCSPEPRAGRSWTAGRARRRMAVVPGSALPVLYGLVVATGWASVQAPGAPPPRSTGRPWATVVALILVGIPSLIQLTAAPGLQAALARRPGELSDGQFWRL